MRIKALIFSCLAGLSLFEGQAMAQSIFYEPCVVQMTSNFEGFSSEKIFLASGDAFMGMSCTELKSFAEGTEMIGLVLAPITAAATTPIVREEIMASLAAYGITLANPVVLAVTVFGGMGVATFYIVLKKSLAECQQQDREQLKKELLQELKRQYPGINSTNVDLEIRSDAA